MIPGAGPTDRNGNSAPGVNANLYAQLAWRLAERGIASLRYDKRAEEPPAVLETLAADAVAAARARQGDRRFGPVVLLGHGEGAWVALRAARTGAPAAGVAVLAASGRRYADRLAEQVARQMDSTAAERVRAAIPRYLAGGTVDGLPPVLQPLFLPGNRAYVRSLAEFDPVGEIAAVPVPVLVAQGGADEQVPVDDAGALRVARGDATLAIIPGAGHFFKPVTSRDPVATLARYRDPTVPVAPELVEALDGWIDGLLRP
jgi:pimeloyl-ACP methyl ester carboxylesterase